jgi:hypothetical protein
LIGWSARLLSAPAAPWRCHSGALSADQTYVPCSFLPLDSAAKTLTCDQKPDTYDLDHLVPLAIYPCNELWNLVPADPVFNQQVKKAKLPGSARLLQAQPVLEDTYARYAGQPLLARALAADVAARFSQLQRLEDSGPSAIVAAVMGLIDYVATSRNVARF